MVAIRSFIKGRKAAEEAKAAKAAEAGRGGDGFVMIWGFSRVMGVPNSGGLFQGKFQSKMDD